MIKLKKSWYLHTLIYTLPQQPATAMASYWGHMECSMLHTFIDWKNMHLMQYFDVSGEDDFSYRICITKSWKFSSADIEVVATSRITGYVIYTARYRHIKAKMPPTTYRHTKNEDISLDIEAFWGQKQIVASLSRFAFFACYHYIRCSHATPLIMETEHWQFHHFYHDRAFFISFPESKILRADSANGHAVLLPRHSVSMFLSINFSLRPSSYSNAPHA